MQRLLGKGEELPILPEFEIRWQGRLPILPEFQN